MSFKVNTKYKLVGNFHDLAYANYNRYWCAVIAHNTFVVTAIDDDGDVAQVQIDNCKYGAIIVAQDLALLEELP